MSDNGLLSQARRLLSSAPLMISNLLGTTVSTPRTNSSGFRRDGQPNSGSRKVKFNDDSNQVKTVSRYLKPNDTFDPYSEGIYAANAAEPATAAVVQSQPTAAPEAASARSGAGSSAPIVIDDDDEVEVETDEEMSDVPATPPLAASHSRSTTVATHAVQHNAPHHGATPTPVPVPVTAASPGAAAPVHGFGILSASPQLQADVPTIAHNGAKRARLEVDATTDPTSTRDNGTAHYTTSVARVQAARQEKTSIDIVRTFMWRGRRKSSRPGHTGPVMQPVRMPGYEPPQVGALDKSAFSGKVASTPTQAWSGVQVQAAVTDVAVTAYVPKAHAALDLVSSSILAISAASVQPLPAQDQVASAALARMAGGFATFRPGVSPPARRRQASHPRSLFAAAKATGPVRPAQPPAAPAAKASQVATGTSAAAGPEDMTRMIMEALGTMTAPPMLLPARSTGSQLTDSKAVPSPQSVAPFTQSSHADAPVPETRVSILSADKPTFGAPMAMVTSANFFDAASGVVRGGGKNVIAQEPYGEGKEFDAHFAGDLWSSMQGVANHVVSVDWEVSFDAF